MYLHTCTQYPHSPSRQHVHTCARTHALTSASALFMDVPSHMHTIPTLTLSSTRTHMPTHARTDKCECTLHGMYLHTCTQYPHSPSRRHVHTCARTHARTHLQVRVSEHASLLQPGRRDSETLNPRRTCRTISRVREQNRAFVCSER
jgi:hypothetical protein